MKNSDDDNAPTVFLRTERLIFRRHESADEEAFVQMHTDPHVRRYVGGQPWSVEKARERFRRQYLDRPRKTYGLWAMALADERRYIGACGLTGNRGTAHLAYYVARPYWRLGIATEAARAFIDVAFSRLRLKQIFADVEKGNHASEHILQKLGFRLVETELLESGRIIDHHRISAPPAS